MPSPLTLWLLAIVSGAVGLRRRRPARPARAGGITGRLLVHCARVPTSDWLVRRCTSRALSANLTAAGMAGGDADRRVAQLRAVLVELGVAVALILAIISPPAAVVGVAFAACGYAMPSLWVAAKARERRRAIVAELPDLIDVVVLCTESGMSLEPALRLAVRHLNGACSEEIALTLSHVDLGEPRRAAYQSLADRTDLAEMRGVVGALLQADELGTPINAALSRQADLLRASRRQRLRDDAAKAAPKVQLVVAMVMVPGALMAVVGVMVLQMIGQLGGITGGMP